MLSNRVNSNAHVYFRLNGVCTQLYARSAWANYMPFLINRSTADFDAMSVLSAIRVGSITRPFGGRHTIPSEVPNLLRGLGSIQQ